MKFLKYLYILLITPIILVILYLNISLFHVATCDKTKQGIVNTEVVHQLNFIKTKIDEGAADEMQDIYPEGFVFLHSLYALAWADISETLQPESELYQKAIQEINASFHIINSEKGKSTFPKGLPLEYGAFYQGWTNYVLAKKLILTPENQRDTSEIQLYQQKCDSIMTAFEKSPYPYLESYVNQSWQADNITALASVALAKKLGFNYSERVDLQVEKIKKTVDTETGLVGHFYDYFNEKSTAPRGSSQSLINIFLFDIDEAFAKKQIGIYKDLFVDYRFGLPGVREHSKGISDVGDIDSGPVIWDIGGAASIVGIRTMGLANETEIYKGLRNSVQGFGAAYTSNEQKKFIFGQLPMADAFIAWANAKNCQINQKSGYWQWKFQLISLGILVVLSGVYVYFFRKRV